jgi:hypothetical protein
MKKPKVMISEARLEALKTELSDKLREKVEVKKKKREFAGFKARLKYASENLAIDVEIRYEKVTSKELESRRKIIHKAIMPDGQVVPVENKPTPRWNWRDNEGKEYPDNAVRHEAILPNGQVVPVESKSNSYKWAWQDSEGKEYPDNVVHHYEVTDNGEVEVSELERTKELVITKTIPLNQVENFLIESQYEIWTDQNIPGLYALAEELAKKDLAAVSRLSFGKGFTEYHAIIYPIKEDGKFLLTMILTKMRKHYKHWMPISNGTQVTAQAKLELKRPTSVLEEL